jgi:hypothetical protein
MKKRCRQALVGLAILLFAFPLLAQPPDTLWTKIYARPGPDVAYSVTETSDGYYLVAGYTGFGAGIQYGWLLKLDKDGDTLWSKPFGGTGYDGLHAVIEASDGGYLAVGFTESFGAGVKDVYIIKTDSDGNQEWTKTYGGGLQDVGYAACRTTGGYVITGYIDGPSGWVKGDAWILKIDEAGDTLWTRRYGGSGEDYCICIREITDGFIMSGVNSMSGSKDAWLVKIDAAGEVLWTKTYGKSAEDVGYGVGLAHDGGYVITGYVDGTGEWTPGDLWLLKTDDAGDTLWTKTYSAGSENFGFDIYPTTDGGYVIGGLKGTNSGDLWILKTDGAGDTTWTGAWGGYTRDNALSLCITSDGGYLAAGMRMPGAVPDLYLVKTRPVLELTAPNGGENLVAETPYTIRWHVENSPQPPHSFRVLFSSDGGASYEDTIASDISPEDTSYNWPVPGDLGNTCRIKVELLDASSEVIAEDESEANFIIGPGVQEKNLASSPFMISVHASSITYHLPIGREVNLAIYDPAGRRVRTLCDGFQNQGTHTLTWDGCDDSGESLPAGVYFLEFTAGEFSQTARMVIVR